MPRRKITVTGAELNALEAALFIIEWKLSDEKAKPSARESELKNLAKTHKGLQSLVTKVHEPPAPKGPSIAWAEAALQGSRKYARFLGGNASFLSLRLAQLGVTQEQLALVGSWLDRAQWMESYDLAMLLSKWSSWLSRASMAADSLKVPRQVDSGPAGFE